MNISRYKSICAVFKWFHRSRFSNGFIAITHFFSYTVKLNCFRSYQLVEADLLVCWPAPGDRIKVEYVLKWYANNISEIQTAIKSMSSKTNKSQISQNQFSRLDLIKSSINLIKVDTFQYKLDICFSELRNLDFETLTFLFEFFLSAAMGVCHLCYT